MTAGGGDGAAPYTADQLEAGIANALAAGDLEAVEAMLRVLYVVDFRRACLVVEAIELGIAIRRAEAER